MSELAAETQRTGLVASISGSTIWRWLHDDAIRPWCHRSWIFPRDPEFATKAGRILDLYARVWAEHPLTADDFVISADEKTSMQARRRRHATQSTRAGAMMKVEHEYERALVQRGDVTLWLSADATDVWRPSPSGQPGGQRKFSDQAIETALTLRLVFQLPLRQAEGFLRSLRFLMGVDLEAPDHTTLSRRSQRLEVRCPRIPVHGPIHLVIDSTGLSIVGEGEWAAAKYGGRGKRGWKKLHLAVDRSGVIVAHAVTDATVDDATTGVALIAATDGDVASVTADAAYDTIAVYDVAGERGATVIIPPARRRWARSGVGARKQVFVAALAIVTAEGA